MQNLSKRQWGHQLSLKQSADLMIEWCIRAREKNVLRKKPPQIFHAYIVDNTPPLQFMQNISSIFKYSQKDMPYIDQARDVLLRSLSVALKAHYFLFADYKVSHEPYFFAIPSLTDPNNTIYGLVYKIEKGNKSIIVCEKKLADLFDNSKVIFEFPVVVIEDSFKWFSTKNWFKIKQECNLSECFDKDWKNSNISLCHDAKTKDELEKFATILDIHFDHKEYIKPLGIEWSKHLKTWCLPKGFDVDAVLEYLEYIKKEHPIIEKNKG